MKTKTNKAYEWFSYEVIVNNVQKDIYGWFRLDGFSKHNGWDYMRYFDKWIKITDDNPTMKLLYFGVNNETAETK